MTDLPERFPTRRRWQFGPLDIRQKFYGVDYYWRGRHVLTSAPRYVMVMTERYCRAWFLHRGGVAYTKDERWP